MQKPKSKFVICLNTGLNEGITRRKIYKVIAEDELFYTIINNSNHKRDYFKHRFKLLEDNEELLELLYG